MTDKRPARARNVLLDLSYDEYSDDDDAVRKGWLDLIDRSPAHLAAHRAGDDPPETEALKMGRLVHAFVLEPGTVDGLYYREPEGDRRTVKFKTALAELADKHQGKTGCRPEEYDLGVRLRDSVFAHRGARVVLEADGAFEQSIYWRNAETGEDCKAKYDKISPLRVFAADVKTTVDASPSAFAKHIVNYRYDVQDAHYTEPLQDLRWVWIAVEKRPPYAVAVYASNPDIRRHGERRRRPNLRLYAECRASGRWPAYPQTIQHISLPRWARL